MKECDEPILEDNYIMYGDYWYVVDGSPIRSDLHNVTVKEYKRRMKAKEIRRCDLIWRQEEQKRKGGV